MENTGLFNAEGKVLSIADVMAMLPLIPKDELIEHLENCLKQPIAQIGNIDYQKGYRQSISDFIDVIKLRWGN